MPKDKNGDRGLIVSTACLGGTLAQHILKFIETKNKKHYLDAEDFIKMMEKYFNNVSKIHYRGEKLQDIHPENAYQVKSIKYYKYYNVILKNSFLLSRTELPLNS